MFSFYLKSVAVFFCVLMMSFAVMGQGKIAGKIVDKNTGEAIIGANITVKDANTGAASDLDGNYLISLPAGTYTLVFEYLGYRTVELDKVAVKDKETTYMNAIMDEGAEELQEVVIQGEVRKESVEALYVQQKNAVTNVSGISADQFRKLPDRTTGDVLKRISGASVQDNKFAVIRGLNERYNMVMVNGVPMPSTESDRKGFSFDLIPSNLLDNMTISKTATADMPGDFAGGIISINTINIPVENRRWLSFRGSYNSITTGREFLHGKGSSTDWLGYDNGARKIPAGISNPPDSDLRKVTQAAADKTMLFNNDFSVLGRRNIESSKFSFTNGARANMSFQGGLSQRFVVFKNDFGVIAALSYNNNNTISPFQNNKPVSGDPTSPKKEGEFFNYTAYKNNVMLGGLLNLSYKVGENNRFSFKNLISNIANDQFSYAEGVRNLDQVVTNNRNYVFNYQSNRIYTSQLSGEHVFGARKIKFKYTGGYNSIDRKIPDYKAIIYLNDPSNNNDYTLLYNSAPPTTFSNGGKFFSNLKENNYTITTDLTIPFNIASVKNEVKVGYFYQSRDRAFTSRLFGYRVDPTKNNLTFQDIERGPDSIFNPSVINPKGFVLNENYIKDYDYSATSKLNAGYVLLDNRLIPEHLRVIWGLRIERYNQVINTASQNVPVVVNTTITDPLPSANLIWSLNQKMNFRFSYSQTISRPEFREFANLAFYDFNLNSNIIGNPQLKRAKINNFDVKYEFYPSPGELFSINPFFKTFKNPTEMVLETSSGIRTFTYSSNNTATNVGVEFELRKSLKEIGKVINSDIFSNITLFANYALIKSSLNLKDLGTTFTSRPLQGQSPYVFTGGIQYSDPEKLDISLIVNRIGRRIAFASNDANNIIWENPRTVIDFTVGKTFFKKLDVKLIAGDLLHQALIFYQDYNLDKKWSGEDKDYIIYKYKFGYTMGLNLSYNF